MEGWWSMWVMGCGGIMGGLVGMVCVGMVVVCGGDYSGMV